MPFINHLYCVLLAAYFAHVVNAAACGAGKYTSGSGCAYCAPGTYQSDNQNPQSSCTSAQSGNYAYGPQTVNGTPGYGATSMSPCQSGTYSTGGAAACTPCPAGYKCTGTEQTTPQACSAGQYQPTTGYGGQTCPLCPAGTYNWIYGATACCNCCAGTYNDIPSQTHCYSCTQHTSSATPYSPVGATSSSQCQSKPIAGVTNDPDSCTNTPSSTQNPAPGTATCPAEQGSGPTPSKVVNKRKLGSSCPKGYIRCASYSGRGGFDCVDVANDVESCGGCVPPDGLTNRSIVSGLGLDCTAISFVNVVRCVRGGCLINSCRRGFRVSSDRRSCTPAIKTSFNHKRKSQI